MLRSFSYLSFFFLLCSLSSFGQRIFWTEPANSRIRVATLSPTTVTGISTFIPGLNQPQNIALDVSSDRLFYNNNSGEDILVSNSIDGSFVSTVITTGAMAGFGAIVYSEDMDGIFTVNAAETDGVQFYPADNGDSGSGTSLNLSGNGGDVYSDVALDNFGRLYVVNSDMQRIFRTTDLTGDVAVLLPSSVGVKYIAVDNLNSKIYYTVESGTTSIWSANLDGTSATQIFSGITQEVTSIKVYPQFGKIYYIRSGVGIYGMNLNGSGDALVTGGIAASVEDFAIEADITAPIVTAFSPLDNSTGFTVYSNLNMTFNENVKVSTTSGTVNETSVRIFKTTGNVLVETISRGAAGIFISGTGVTIDPSADLDPITDYYVLIGNKVFADLSNNNYAGLGSASLWNFKTDYDLSQYYSRQSGPYDDPNTWTNDPSHSGPAVSFGPGSGIDTHIGSGHTVILTDFTTVEQNNSGLTIEVGGTLNANNFTLDAFGSGIQIDGTLLNGGELSGMFDLAASSGAPIFYEVNCGFTGFPGVSCNLATDVIAVNGLHPIDGGVLNTNGFNVCDGSMAQPSGYVFSNQKSTSVTLSWILGAGDAFIVARQGSTGFKPNFKTLYNANAVFGSGDAVGTGNFVVYAGSDTSVTITGLSPNTYYEFDLYSYNTTVGGCYSVMNYQVANFTTCAPMAAPTNPVGASYCAGDIKPAINVNSPGPGRNINWYDAATLGNLVPGDVSGGDGRGGVFIPTAASGTFYAEIYDGTSQCTSDTRTAVTLTQNPIVTPGVATGIQTVCVGDDPTVISGGTATGGDGNYTYQWESATASTTGPYTAISTATAVNYDPPAGILLTTHYRLRVTSSTCTSQVGNFVSVTIGSPTNVTALTNTPGDAQITLNWTNPVSCFEEILIIGKQGGTPVSTPVGDGTAYTANAVFGNGTAVVPGEFVVYKGTGTSVIVTGLTNSISYSFTVFTRKGIAWSAGAITSGTGIPTPPIITFVPANGSTNISVTSNLSISFNEPVRNVDNSVIDNGNVSSLLAFKLSSSAGADVPFVATINGAKDAITIDPTTALLPSQLYYLSIAPVEDSNNNASIASVITFTTQAGPSITNITPLSVCVGQNVSITGTNFGTALPTVSINSVNIPVIAHTATSITIVPSIAASGVVTVTNMDLSISTVSSQTLTISTLPTAFAITGGGAYCAGGNGVAIGLANSQAGVEYEVYLGASATGVKFTPGGGAFNFTGFFTAAGTYSVKGKNAGGCSTDMTGTAVVTINDIPSGTGSIAASATSICQGSSVTLTAQGFQNALTYVWTLPAGLSTTSSTSGSAITVTGDAVPGGLVTVTARNNCGPGTPASTSITVNSLPVVSITAPPPNEQILDDVLQFTSEVDIPVSSYAWDFGDGGSSADANTEHTYTSEGQFNVTLIVKTTSGCEGNAGTSVSISEFPVLSSSAIKNVITANEDGKNDRLIVDNIDRFPNNTLSVLDRWGVEVHKQDAYNNEWDFKKGGNYLPAGSYVCIVKLNDSNTVITRTVTLIRK
jgi:gliding motility-associated-like protein